MMNMHCQVGPIPPDFRLPVENYRRRCHDEVCTRNVIFFTIKHKGNYLHGFSKTHIISKYSSELVFSKEAQPVQSLHLVIAEGCFKSPGNSYALNSADIRKSVPVMFNGLFNL